MVYPVENEVILPAHLGMGVSPRDEADKVSHAAGAVFRCLIPERNALASARHTCSLESNVGGIWADLIGAKVSWRRRGLLWPLPG